jgi:tetratricopeptide (TPR) repeat protein
MTQSPTDDEVRSQLERILTSKLFRNAATQSKLLRLVVEKAIEKQQLSEMDIGFGIFENYDTDSHKVRANANLVRDKLAEFSDQEGQNDAVRIDFPPGAAYKAIWFYNRSKEAIHSVKVGRGLKARGHLTFLNDAISEFQRAIELEPTYAEAYAELGEAFLIQQLMDGLFSKPRLRAREMEDVDFREKEMRAVDFAMKALTLDAKCVLAHLVCAADCIFRFRWNEASDTFATAMALDPSQTEASLWYAAYLILNGQSDEGISLAMQQVQERPEHLGIHLAAACLCIIANNDLFYSVAWRLLLSEEMQRWARLLMGLAKMNCGDDYDAISGLIDASRGRKIIWDETLEEIVKKSADAMAGKVFRRTDWPWPKARIGELPGLVALCLTKMGSEDAARSWVARLVGERAKPFQRAIGYIAIGRKRRAILALQRAKTDHDVYLNLLHMPLFDELRDEREFQKLVVSIKGK